MNRLMAHLAAPAIALALFAAPVSAAPASPQALSSVEKTAKAGSNVADVQMRRGFRGNRGWRGNRFRGGRWGYRRRGSNAGAIIGGLVAGALIAGAIRESRASSGDIERCEATYRSFNPRTGTYVGYDGVERVCPYLN